eukprot:scaffold16865_cov229-Ochromonas_danica.AAC.1
MTFGPALHSISILKEDKQTASCDDSGLYSSLSCFFGHCIHLEGVNQSLSGIHSNECVKWDSILYEALNNHLQGNQLVKLGFYFDERDILLLDKVGTWLSKHDKCLKALAVSDWSKDNPGFIHVLENLIKSRHALRALDMTVAFNSCNNTILPSLLQYLSSAGMLLETLIVNYFGEEDISWNEGD